MELDSRNGWWHLYPHRWQGHSSSKTSLKMLRLGAALGGLLLGCSWDGPSCAAVTHRMDVPSVTLAMGTDPGAGDKLAMRNVKHRLRNSWGSRK